MIVSLNDAPQILKALGIDSRNVNSLNFAFPTDGWIEATVTKLLSRDDFHKISRYLEEDEKDDTIKKFLKFLPIARQVAQLSKDPSTKAGALILGAQGEGGPWGYNGAPRGCDADENKNLDRDLKLMVFEHAERNAIYAAARQGFPTIGCTMVITHFPCCDCARAIIQSGITTVVCPTPDPGFAERWAKSICVSRSLFEECGVTVLEVPNVSPTS